MNVDLMLTVQNTQKHVKHCRFTVAGIITQADGGPYPTPIPSVPSSRTPDEDVTMNGDEKTTMGVEDIE